MSQRWAAVDSWWNLAPSPSGGAPVFLLAAGWGCGSGTVNRMLTASGELLLWSEPYGGAGIIEGLAASARHLDPSWPQPEHVVADPPHPPSAGERAANLYPSPGDLKAALRGMLDRWLAEPARARGLARFGVSEVRLGAFHADFLRWLYPDARFVVLVRDPWAAWERYRGRAWHLRLPDARLETAEQFGRHYAQVARGFVASAHESVRLVRYEDLLDPGFDRDGLAAHCRLSTMDGVPDADPAVGAPLPTADVSAIERTCGELAERLGYRSPRGPATVVAVEDRPAAGRAHAVLVSFDDRMQVLGRGCIASIRKNWPSHPQILVNYHGSDPDVQAAIDATAGVRRLPALDPAPFQGLSGGNGFPPSVYYRFHLFTEAFDAYESVVYLDADTLVRRPLDGLIARDAFFMVADHHPSLRLFVDMHAAPLRALLEEDGFSDLDRPGAMGNSGVLVVPRRYRTRAHFDELLALARRYGPHLAYPDQAVLTLWCRRHGLPLSDELGYNLLTWVLTSQYLPPLDEVRVFHAAGSAKFGSAAWAQHVRASQALLTLTSEYNTLLREAGIIGTSRS